METGMKEYRKVLAMHKGRILLILLILLIVVLAFLILDEKYQWTGQAIKDPSPQFPVEEVGSEHAGYEDVTVTSTT